MGNDRTEYKTVEERRERGKLEREKLPRAYHAIWDAPTDRPDPIAILEKQAETRDQELVPIRHGRMATTPFAFYRGAAAIMASDLASLPRTGIEAQLGGDAHLSNFGGFSAPDRVLIFDQNDFDETLPGPWEWDLKRLTTSFVIAGRGQGMDPKRRGAMVRTVTKGYREAIRRFAKMHNLDVWYTRYDMNDALTDLRKRVGPKSEKRMEQVMAKAAAKNSGRAFDKLTEIRDGRRRIVSAPPLVVPADELFSDVDATELWDSLGAALRRYQRSIAKDRRHLLQEYRLVDVARKVVGVGSVGTRAWIALLLGLDDGDPLFLQVKQAEASVLEPFVRKSEFDNHGQRVVEGQRLTQAASDIFLGWDRIQGLDGVTRDYYFRQLWDGKLSVDVDAMSAEGMTLFAELCGWTLARSHARSGDRVAIASYLGKGDEFDEALVTFGESYADQNDRDYAALQEAIVSGRIPAQHGI